MVIMKTIKVRRTSFRELNQSKLANYADNVVKKTTGKPDYDVIRTLLDQLNTVNTVYTVSLGDALSRDKAAVVAKTDDKKAVLAALEQIATGLEMNANGSELYVVRAGMEVHKQRTVHTSEMPPVTDLVLEATLIAGQMLVKFKYPASYRRQVETFAVEWSADNGQTWTNGTYKNAVRITVSDLPNRTEVIVRVRALGSRERKSPWTVSNTAFVL